MTDINALPWVTKVTGGTHPKTKSEPIAVECLECGRKFKTRSTLPSCPKCGGVDIDVRS